MRLNDEQLQVFKRDGYLFFPRIFSQAEVDLLMAEVPKIFSEKTPKNILEKNGHSVRTNFAAHTSNKVFRRLSRHPYIINTARQVLGSEVYIHQFKINAKLAFDGDMWEWHQDSPTWFMEDGMVKDQAINWMVFLDPVTDFNGPIMLIPGSHKHRLTLDNLDDRWKKDEASPSLPIWMKNLTSHLNHAVSNDRITELVKQGGIVAPKGPAGSMLLFHSSIVHGSTNNMSPFNRTSVIISLNSVENALRDVANPRPEFVACRDFAPVIPLPVESLLVAEEATSSRV